MFRASAPLLLFDELRVPYVVDDDAGEDARWGTLRRAAGDGARVLLWPRLSASERRAAVGEYRLDGIPIFARVLADEAVARRLPRGVTCAGWEADAQVTDVAGKPVAAVRRDADGALLLPFDPAEAVMNLRTERYRRLGRAALGARALRGAKQAYYRARPLLPRSAQLALRRRFTSVQQRAAFPRWPVEPALHDFCELLVGLLAEACGEPLPAIAPWPAGRRWALVLTHDVETQVGHDHVALLRERELRHGVRSSWNFVPRRYEVDDALVGALLADGFEVGVHGLHHDGRDLASRALVRRRLPQMHAYAARWRASGFRSPALNRDWAVIRAIGFDYDSSYPDTDPYQPDPGGCCSWLPFFNGDVVELPITLPQDHTLWEILGRRDPAEWFEKAREVRRRAGMALLITHPDYMLAPERLDAYERFVAVFAADPTTWCALPRDVAGWWRRRARSRLERRDGTWAIAGPAAVDGRVVLVGDQPAAVDALAK